MPKISLLKFLAKPEEALAQVKPAMPPQQRETTAMTTRRIPFLISSSISTPFLMLLIKSAVIKGIKVSITASQTINNRVRKTAVLYCLTLFASRFSISLNFVPFRKGLPKSPFLHKYQYPYYCITKGKKCQFVFCEISGTSNHCFWRTCQK